MKPPPLRPGIGLASIAGATMPTGFAPHGRQGNRVGDVLAPEIDAVLHRERLSVGQKRLHPLPKPLEKLPDGAMVQAGEESFLIAQGKALQWSPAGYRAVQARSRMRSC